MSDLRGQLPSTGPVADVCDRAVGASGPFLAHFRAFSRFLPQLNLFLVLVQEKRSHRFGDITHQPVQICLWGP